MQPTWSVNPFLFDWALYGINLLNAFFAAFPISALLYIKEDPLHIFLINEHNHLKLYLPKL